MLPVPDAVALKLPHLPDGPGVYLWKSADGPTLYVGKAKRLRSRVRSYFASDQLGNVKTRHLIGLIADLDTIVVPSEAHALILEANLIKEYRPRFNIALRDDKSYPYIKVTVQEPFPRVYVTRRLDDDGASYFGPYTDVGAMRRALNVVKRIFTVRSCNYDMPAQMPERPCLDYYIKRCSRESSFPLRIRSTVTQASSPSRAYPTTSRSPPSTSRTIVGSSICSRWCRTSRSSAARSKSSCSAERSIRSVTRRITSSGLPERNNTTSSIIPRYSCWDCASMHGALQRLM